MLRAITLDFWDTLYASAVLPERVTLRQTALRRLLDAVGAAATDEQIRTVYAASGAEAERWWREEHRGYTSAERIRWMLERLKVDRPEDCEHVARACDAVDQALIDRARDFIVMRGTQWLETDSVAFQGHRFEMNHDCC